MAPLASGHKQALEFAIGEHLLNSVTCGFLFCTAQDSDETPSSMWLLSTRLFRLCVDRGSWKINWHSSESFFLVLINFNFFFFFCPPLSLLIRLLFLSFFFSLFFSLTISSFLYLCLSVSLSLYESTLLLDIAYIIFLHRTPKIYEIMKISQL